MNRFLKNIAGFGSVLFLIFLGINVFLSKFNDEPPHYRLQYEEALSQDSKVNGAIIGNSTATHSIRPSLLDTLDIKFYNLALNGSAQDFYLDWYNDLFEKNHPKLDYWIISADHFFLTGSGRKLTDDSEYFSFGNFWSLLIGDNDYDKKALIANKIPLFKYRSRMKESFNDNTQGNYRFLIEEYDRGYISLERTDSFDFSGSDEVKSSITKGQKETFLKFIERLSESGSQVVFIIPPELNLEEKQYEDQKEFLRHVSSEKGIPFYDFNDEVYSELLNKREYFCDQYHLNKKGSVVLSDLLRKELYEGEKSLIRKK